MRRNIKLEPLLENKNKNNRNSFVRNTLRSIKNQQKYKTKKTENDYHKKYQKNV